MQKTNSNYQYFDADNISWEIPASLTVQLVVFRNTDMPSGGEVLIY